MRQILAVIGLSLRSIGGRLPTAAVVVTSIGGVVAILVGLLAMSEGFRTALVDTAKADRALVLRGSSSNEMDGWVTPEELAILQSLDLLTVVSGEVYVTVNATNRDAETDSDVVVRGVSAAAFTLRPEVTLVEGRRHESGRNEAIVGVKAAALYEGLEIGDEIEVRGSSWEVVGHFSGQGTSVESEIWVDLPITQSVFRRVLSLARVGVAPGEVQSAVAAVSDDPRLDLVLIPETDFYAEQSRVHAGLIQTFAYLIAGIMALGAVAAALNAMFTVVDQRSKEIATLRALGFGAGSVVAAVLVESVLLALAGAGIAGALVYLALDGSVASTQNAAAGNPLAFALTVTPAILWQGLVGALIVGMLGGLLPALRAARASVAVALRGR
jgi:putative ABC transport system permease protein